MLTDLGPWGRHRGSVSVAMKEKNTRNRYIKGHARSLGVLLLSDFLVHLPHAVSLNVYDWSVSVNNSLCLSPWEADLRYQSAAGAHAQPVRRHFPTGK